MNIIERMIAGVAPVAALRRAQARLALSRVTSYYEAGAVSSRTSNRRAPGTDADAASASRRRIAYVTRDMVRNTPFAARAQAVIANNVVGQGIIPKVRVPLALSDAQKAKLKALMLELIERDVDTTSIDADGRQTLYGLQRLVMNAVVGDGECLVVRVSKPLEPLKIRVLEADYIDGTQTGRALSVGGYLRDGIEFDKRGNRVAYHLFEQHPGSDQVIGAKSALSKRVPAEDVLHIFRQDRPGQHRGVSWFAPIAISMADFDEYQDAQLMRQKIAACFVAFRTRDPKPGEVAGAASDIDELRPGVIEDIGTDETINFASPPDPGDFEPFARSILRAAAAGVGITYESMTGDMTGVNFSQARMGRSEMNRQIETWQANMILPQLLEPLTRWLVQGWAPDLAPLGSRVMQEVLRHQNRILQWIPPHLTLVDPTREIPAMAEAVRAGFASRSGTVMKLGDDPERLEAEIAEENARADGAGLQFESDYRFAKPKANAAAVQDGTAENDQVSAPVTNGGRGETARGTVGLTSTLRRTGF